jgi:L-cystine transport system permease protein
MGFSFNQTYFVKTFFDILSFLPVTLFLCILSLFFGALLGIFLTVMKLSGTKLLSKLAFSYSNMIRSTPTIILLFLVYYGLPKIVPFFDMNEAPAGASVILTFSLYTAAYFSEIFRSSYLAVSKRQYEAAVSVGLNDVQALREVILPQVFLISIPNIGNIIINTLKEMSLAFTIGTVDLLGRAQIIIANSYGAHTVEIYIASAILYLLLSIGLDVSFRRIERRSSKYF